MFLHIDETPLIKDKFNLSVEEGKGGRRYITPEGNKYPSITTVLSIRSKDSIQEWKNRVGEEESNRVSKRASTRGTKIHSMIEDYLNNIPLDLNKEMPIYRFNFNSIKPELDKIQCVYHQEVALYSDIFKIAGRVDCIGVYDGVLSVIDFKTSSKMKTSDMIENYFIQASFYAAAYYEMTGLAIKQIVILIATDEGKPQIFIENPYKWLYKLKEVKSEYDKRKLFGQV